MIKIRKLITTISLGLLLSTTLNAASVEPETRKFLDAVNSQKGPALYQMPIEDARNFLETVQSNNTQEAPVDVVDKNLYTKYGKVTVTIVRPKNNKEVLPAVIYMHGGGWILGSKNTHRVLISKIANQAKVAVVFVNFTPSPEARFPVAIEQGYSVLEYLSQKGAELNINPNKIAVAGDSVGGNMATVMALIAKDRKGPKISYQVLFYPVTDANFNNATYKEFGKGGYFLTTKAMEWFWNAYADESTRKNIYVSPLNASVEQLRNLPDALVITAEYDVLRNEGEDYAAKLSEAGVRTTRTRYLGTMHDFVMLQPLQNTPAAVAAIEQASKALHNALHN